MRSVRIKALDVVEFLAGIGNYSFLDILQIEVPLNKTQIKVLRAFSGFASFVWITFFVWIAVYVFPKSNPSVSSKNSIVPQSNPSVSSKNSTVPQSNQSVLITQKQAVSLIYKYLKAKARMFAPPYDRQLAAELTTGRIYEELAGQDGSINWLQIHQAYYEFGKQSIDSVYKFSQNGNSALIQLRLTEESFFYNSNGVIDQDKSVLTTTNITYILEFVDGRWKIASREVNKNLPIDKK
ncbi:ARC6/PARC6 family protein [Sphaerospermopsis aphanizomenoides BCCUSP55]|nr:ARC6/PARC6 family protein [Sphaerospermopsis aphanizomenoides BCCUSP55]